MIIKNRLIEVDVAEALAIAGKGEKVFCLVRSGTLDGWSNMQTVTLDEMLDGCMFFAGESNLMADAGPAGGNPTISPGPAHFDTPENRTRAIVDSVERYDEEHGDPPTTKQDAEDALEDAKEVLRKHAPKAEALTREYGGEAPKPVPFEGAPSGGR